MLFANAVTRVFCVVARWLISSLKYQINYDIARVRHPTEVCGNFLSVYRPPGENRKRDLSLANYN